MVRTSSERALELHLLTDFQFFLPQFCGNWLSLLQCLPYLPLLLVLFLLLALQTLAIDVLSPLASKAPNLIVSNSGYGGSCCMRNGQMSTIVRAWSVRSLLLEE